jgi:hypothetical protein
MVLSLASLLRELMLTPNSQGNMFWKIREVLLPQVGMNWKAVPKRVSELGNTRGAFLGALALPFTAPEEIRKRIGKL